MLRSIREEVGKRLNTQSIGLGEEVEHPKGSKLLIISRRWFPAPFWQGIIGSRPIFVSVVGGSPREYWQFVMGRTVLRLNRVTLLSKLSPCSH